MPIQPWRTFLLSGVVPATPDERTVIGWALQEPHRADPRTATHTQAHRLLGPTPVCQVHGERLELIASSKEDAVYRSASLELEMGLLSVLRGGDVLTIARTMTEDIGVSVLRAGVLLWAVGAIAAVPLGRGVRAQLGPPIAEGRISAERWPATDTWVDVSCGTSERALRDGEAASIGDFEITVRHAAKPAGAGAARRENAAISRAAARLHDSAYRASERLDREHAGLVLRAW